MEVGMGAEWRIWQVQDQRFVDHRPDVLTLATEPLTADVIVSGKITANIFASTTGTDSDWIVKLIDVYPDSFPIRSNDERIPVDDRR